MGVLTGKVKTSGHHEAKTPQSQRDESRHCPRKPTATRHADCARYKSRRDAPSDLIETQCDRGFNQDSNGGIATPEDEDI